MNEEYYAIADLPQCKQVGCVACGAWQAKIDKVVDQVRKDLTADYEAERAMHVLSWWSNEASTKDILDIAGCRDASIRAALRRHLQRGFVTRHRGAHGAWLWRLTDKGQRHLRGSLATRPTTIL